MFIVLVAAVVAPLVGEFTSKFGLSVVVLELLLGVIIGPHALGWATPTHAVPYLAQFGMAFLFFLAGTEIDLLAIREQLRSALVGWLLGFGIALLAALGMQALGLIQTWQVVAIAIATTALGVLVPIIRDHGLLDKPLGQHILAAGALGELAPIIVMSVLLSRRHTAPVQTAFTALFLVLMVIIGWAAVQGRTPPVIRVLSRTLHQSSQLPIRIVVVLLVGLAVLADAFGLDLALGALAAGMIIGAAARDSADKDVLHLKLDAVGYGLLVPVFFITSGMKLDIAALFSGTSGIALAGAFLVAVLVSRLPLVGLNLRVLGPKLSCTLGLFSATTLSLIVALTEIAMSHGLMTPAETAPLVAAGMVSVILFPALGLRLAREPNAD